MTRALAYGAIAGAIPVAITVMGLMFDLPNHVHSVWFGYLVMLLSLSLIFVGVKRHRDIDRGGVIGFGRAFGLGLGIAAIAGVVYMLGWEVYLGVTGYDFMADYTAGTLRTMRADGASPNELAAAEATMRELAEQYRNPLFRLPMTFTEIFPVGVVVALISAVLLRHPRPLADRRA